MNLKIRPALASDLDALTWIGLAAIPFEPQWPYRYPFAAEFPEDHNKFTRIRYSEWLEAASTPECIIMVAESPSLQDKNITKVVGLSIWRIPRRGSNGESNNKCLNPCPSHPILTSSQEQKNRRLRKSIGRAQEEYFDQVYGTNQLSLAQLATHPDYFGRGTATMLLEWGVALAKKERWPITVFAGPMAYNLYKRFGFKTLVRVTTQVLDEEEKIEFPGMAWEPIDSVAKNERRCVSSAHQLLVVYDSHRASLSG